MRSVLLALSAPAALSLLGVAWPLLHAASYELHARAFQRTAVFVGVLARLVVAVLSPPWSQQAGFVKRSFIFDAFMLVIHQVRWGGWRGHFCGKRFPTVFNPYRRGCSQLVCSLGRRTRWTSFSSSSLPYSASTTWAVSCSSRLQATMLQATRRQLQPALTITICPR